MKTIATLLLVITYMGIGNAQRGNKIKGNGNTVEIERQTADYDAIFLGGFFDVELVEGDEGTITLTGEDNILEYIETEVSGGTLLVKSKDHMQLRPSAGNKVFVSIPVDEIDAIRLSGSGKVTGKKLFKANTFKVRTSGSKNGTLNIKANTINVTTSGSSNLSLGGAAEKLDITTSGSSNLSAFELRADVANIRSSGSSNIRLTVNHGLDSRSSGSSNIKYRGNPEKVVSKASGSSRTSKD